MAAVMDKTLQEAATGAIVAYAVGDALGWPVEPRGNRVGGTRDLTPELEFKQWRRREGGRYAPHEEEMPAGTYSDDTQLTLAVARSLMHDDWWLHFTRVELPWWQQYELGGGGALRRAAQAWSKGKTPWTPDAGAKGYWTAGGNGAAMRVLPHAAHSHQFEDARRDVLADGAASHGDPVALVGAQLFAYALWLMLHRTAPLGWGELLDDVIHHVDLWAQFEPDVVPDHWIEHLPDDYPERWHRTVEQTTDQLIYARNQLAHGSLNVDSRVLDDLGCFSKTGGAGTTTTVSAIYMASRHASDPTQGLLRAAFAYGADTDTLAAMTGALLGSIHHVDWLGAISQNVTDSQLLHRIFTDKQTSGHDEATPYSKGAQRYVESELARSKPGSTLALPFYGEATVTAVRDLDNRTAQIRSWWLTTADGQTFRIKRVSRAKRQPWIALPQPKLPPHPPRARRPPLNGFVMQVADMRAERLFYEELLGLPVSHETDRTVTIRGWLVLEQSPKARREPKLDYPPPFAVTLYAHDEEFQELQRRLDQQGVSYVLAPQTPSILATADPEGFPIEIRKI
jgi:ADP-ribosylglycohydrolase/catechol 2,3-dioxygenase-like lactoylglutathione lyase family enzyme